MDHGYLCDCSKCNYERTLKRVREMQNKYREEEEQKFFYGEDPFPPRTSTGRFKVHNPPYNVGRKEGQRKWRRYHDQALDVFNWQYQPWPGHEWVTYFTVTHEALVRTHNLSFAGQQAVLNAHKALSEKRFYKVERVN